MTVTRRNNLALLLTEFTEAHLRNGGNAKGVMGEFAKQVQLSGSALSQHRSHRPIGDKVARQIESGCGKEPGWLDRERPHELETDAERKFIELARKAWRSSNARGKRALRSWLAGHAKAPDS